MSNLPYKPYRKKKYYAKEDPHSQRIIIPKGCINPNQTTIIEIPERCDNVSTIFAGNRERSLSTSSIPNSIQEENEYVTPQRHTRHISTCPLYRKPQHLNTYRTIEEDEYEDDMEHDFNGASPNSEADLKALKSNNYHKNTKNSEDEYEEEQEDNQYVKQSRLRPLTLKKFYRPRVNQNLQVMQEPVQNPRVNQQVMQEPAQRAPQGRHYRHPVFYKMAQQSKAKNERINTVLDKLDAVELRGLEHDLKNFQIARRKLLFDVSSMKMF